MTGGTMDASVLESILEELRSLNENISGLREEMKVAGKAGAEKMMENVMTQMSSAFKGTPMEGIVANMMKGGAKNG